MVIVIKYIIQYNNSDKQVVTNNNYRVIENKKLYKQQVYFLNTILLSTLALVMILDQIEYNKNNNVFVQFGMKITFKQITYNIIKIKMY